MAILGGEGHDLGVDAIEQIPGPCVGGLVPDMNVLVLEQTCFGVEFSPKLGKRVTALANSQLYFHRNESP
jgi:hypothetical protein